MELGTSARDLHEGEGWSRDLQEVEDALESAIRSFVDGLSNQEGQLVRVLARRGYTNCTAPVVVHMSKFVRQSLNLVGGQAAGTVEHAVRGGRNGALSHVLRNQVKIELQRVGDDVVHDGSRGWVVLVVEEASVDALVDQDESKLHQIGFAVRFVQSLPDGCYLVFHHVLDVTLTDTVAVNHNTTWTHAILLFVLSQSFYHVRGKVVG